ncbi:hypothetical protein WA026_015595 [Henosepilachna vigintioctopunctata]|uniref:MBD domain-containing protein n=1 Tax=Henosepilachna vigintioctopunctata TaxID=420089 RepID=A0AAW1VG71_9CUCU
MEIDKPVETQTKDSSENTPDSEINGEKSPEIEETFAMEVEETKSVSNDKSDETESDANIEDEKIDITNKPGENTEQENITEKKTLKRKVSEMLKDNKGNVEDSQETGQDVIEDESPEKADEKKEDERENSDMSQTPSQGYRKGKRARVPNKRYSDIALSPSIKANKLSHLENGDKEKPISAVPIERVESDITRNNSPLPKRTKTSSFDLANPNFLKPFKFGWKRELVWRSVGDIGGKRNGDIYYYSPEGKKLRSMREVGESLIRNKDLNIEDFTFFKEPLGLNDPEKEIIRDAKIKAGSASALAAKKNAIHKAKKIISPKVASPKVASPKVASPKVASPKVASPKVMSPKLESATSSSLSPKSNPSKSDHAEENKPLKSTRSSSAALLKITNTTADSGSEEKTVKSSTLKVKIASKPKIEKKQPAPSKQVTASSEEDSSMVGKKVTPRKSGKWAQKPVTSESSMKSPSTKKKTLKLNNITNQVSEKSIESKFMENYLQNLSYGYNTLLYVFQYLKVQDLLRAGCVCTMWRDIASHSLLWRTVRMKNSQVHSFEGLSNTLQRHGTVQLDLRKMLLTNGDEIWPEFSSNIGKVETLRKIELCRCPASVVEKLTETNRKLEVVNAVTIRCETINLEGLANWTNLRELRLKSTTGLNLASDIDSLKCLSNLKILSLTSIRELNTLKLDVISELTSLESLDLGECTDFPENFGKDILTKLTKLEKLRLEKGQGHCHTFEILDAVRGMPQLEQLELVNFDIKAGFDKALGACKNIKKLLIIPTYISQSATTNHMVLGGVLRLQKSLSHFVWGVTLELLRVTELFVDQCEEPDQKEKKEKKLIGNGDSIPVLKPVPLITDDKCEIPPALDPPQVEILALPGLQKLLLQSLPTTRVKILKIPFHATWRQSITDAVN